MSKTVIRLPGVGAAVITSGTGRILVDASNDLNEAPEIRENDVIVFTHADRDHFAVEKIPDLRGKNIQVLGPPSIAVPLLLSGKADPDRSIFAYPETPDGFETFETNGVKISFVQSRHFNDWNPIHCSYLIEIGGRRIYVTGDSLVESQTAFLSRIDCMICNLVDKGYITKSDDRSFAIHHLLSYLLRIISEYDPGRIIANHLIGFDGTVDPRDLKKLVEDYSFASIIVPIDGSDHVFLD